ncbi:MAG: hypothetical protein ACLSDH_00680 [Bacilli bacterium]|jgi:hypothetical protein
MKKLLSAILSVSLLCASTNSYCFAKTAWNSYSREGSAKPISVFKQKDGEKVIVKGEESPTIVINNKSESKSSAHASSGSTFSKLFLLAIKLGIGVLAAKFAISKLKSFGGHVSEGVSKGFNSFKDLALNFTELMNKNKLQNEENEEGNIEKSSFLDKFKNLFNLKNVFDIGLLYSMISSKDCSLS